MTNQNYEPDEPAGDVTEDKGGKVGLAGILPLIIISVAAILVVVWLFAH